MIATTINLEGFINVLKLFLFLPNQDLSRSLESEKKSSEAVLLRLFPSLSGKNDLEAEAQEALEAMAKGEAHYKNVLAQTDSMLTSLQASVETAEAEWRLKLEAANKWVFRLICILLSAPTE